MIVAKKQEIKNRIQLENRSSKTIEYALNQIRTSVIAPFVQKVYLYGSCARHEQTYTSDVDLFLELDKDFDLEKHKTDVLLLKSTVSPLDIGEPEVDLKVTIGEDWKNNHMLYYQNVRKEGVDIWQKQ